MLKLDLQYFAKLSKKFTSKGSLDMSTGKIYETKKVGKEDIVVEVDFFGFLREFDRKNISISVTEEEEVTNAEEDLEEDLYSEDEE